MRNSGPIERPPPTRRCISAENKLFSNYVSQQTTGPAVADCNGDCLETWADLRRAYACCESLRSSFRRDSLHYYSQRRSQFATCGAAWKSCRETVLASLGRNLFWNLVSFPILIHVTCHRNVVPFHVVIHLVYRGHVFVAVMQMSRSSFWCFFRIPDHPRYVMIHNDRDSFSFSYVHAHAH